MPDAELVDLLLGPSADLVLGAAVTQRGGELWAARPAQVVYRPGEALTVLYDATVSWADGGTADEALVVLADATGLPAGAQRVQAGSSTVAVWRYPEDPALPALAIAAEPAVAGRCLGVPPGQVSVNVAAYRPGRRAVLEAEAEDGGVVFGAGGFTKRSRRVFLKVLPPAVAPRVREIHDRLQDGIPVARCTDGPAPGLLVLEALEGRTLRRCLLDGAPVPSAADVLELLDRFGQTPLPGNAVRTVTERAHGQARLLRAVLPEQAGRIDRIVQRLGTDAEQPTVTVHGDFHESQLLVTDGRIRGVLDVDGAGPGQRVDDVALMVGRLWALSQGSSRAAGPVARYTQELFETACERVDAGELRRRIGAVMLGRATGPFRNQLEGWRRKSAQRIALAHEWLERPTRELFAA
jgi:hypothetical protein